MRTLLVLLLSGATINAAGKVELVADGLKEPFGLGFRKKDILVAEFGAHRVVSVSPTGKVTVLAGSGKPGSADGVGEAATLNGPHNLVVSPAGTIIVADTFNHRLRGVSVDDKQVDTLSGSDKGFAGDGGSCDHAKFDQLYHVAVNPKEDGFFLCDLGNRRIRRIDMKTGVITTIAGNGQKGVPKDGEPAKDQPLVDPRAVEADAKGRLWILERGGNALRVVEDGKIRTVAGTGKAGFSRDDGPAIQATFNGPKNLFITKDNKALIADTENHCIREFDPETGKVRRVMGTGKKGKGEVGGAPLETALSRPHAVAVDAAGTMYVSDSDNGRVLKVSK